ncbi:hypothetical protein LUZ60_001767 [Juncus effusus]|nr:hypothetical protein LUZ60_001767 [Juncus effusus]
MGESYARWEADPLFSAAEVVQDSADRMDSVYRSLLHEEKLMQNQNSNLVSSIKYHKRDLSTSLETTRWQLEDFARAVDFASLSDNSTSRKNAILKFNQFIQAIREQIIQVEKNLNNSNLGELGQSSEILNSKNEQEIDSLASFLSNNWDPLVRNEINENDIMRRFMDSNANNHEEIVEIKEEILETNNGFESSSNDLEMGNYDAKYYLKNNNNGGIMRPNWNILRRFWPSNRGNESFTKRRKDGEILNDDEIKLSPLITNTPIAEKYRIPLASAAILCLLVFIIKVV